MANVTKKGRELYRELYRVTPPTLTNMNPLDNHILHQEAMELCSLICRHSVTYSRIQEMWCNVAMDDRETKRWEKKETALENRIAELVGRLPGFRMERKEKPIKPKFNGDPRGYTVKLVMPDGRYNTWGGAEDGIGVVGS